MAHHSHVCCPVPQCTDSEQKYQYFEDIKQHVSKEHPQFIVVNAVDLFGKSYQYLCRECQLKFPKYSKLRDHYRACLERRPANPSNDTADNYIFHLTSVSDPTLLHFEDVYVSDEQNTRTELRRQEDVHFTSERGRIINEYLLLYSDFPNSMSEVIRAIGLSSKTLETVLDHCNLLIKRVLTDCEDLREIENKIDSIFELPYHKNILEPIGTHYHFEQYVSSHVTHGNAEFVQFMSDTSNTRRWTGSHAKCVSQPGDFELTDRIGAYFVPIEDSLRRLFKSCPKLIDSLQRSPAKPPAVYSEIFHGSAVRDNPLLNDPTKKTVALGIVTDDVQINDKSGEHQCVINGAILNLPQEYRNEATGLWLIGQGAAKHMKNYYESMAPGSDHSILRGLDLALIHISKQIEHLSEHGFDILTTGEDGEQHVQKVYVTLVQFFGDKKAFHEGLNYVAGFTAFRPCAMCSITKDNMKNTFDPALFPKRSPAELAAAAKDSEEAFAEMRNLVDPAIEKSGILAHSKKVTAAKARVVRAMKSGVIGSCYLSAPFWDILKNPYIDPMHDADTGAGPYCIEAICNAAQLDKTKVFDVKLLNRRIFDFRFGKTDVRDKFRPFCSVEAMRIGHTKPNSDATNKTELIHFHGFKASQFLKFMQLLDQLVPETDLSRDTDYWYLLNAARSMTLAIHSKRMTVKEAKAFPVFMKDFIARLSATGFSMTRPKFHYLLHLQEYLLRYGPPALQMCYQNERTLNKVVSQARAFGHSSTNLEYSSVKSTLMKQAINWRSAALFADNYTLLEKSSFKPIKQTLIDQVSPQLREMLMGKFIARRFIFRGCPYVSGGVIVHKIKYGHPQAIAPVQIVGLVSAAQCVVETVFVLVKELQHHAKLEHIEASFVVDTNSDKYRAIDLADSDFYHQMDPYPHYDSDNLKRIYLPFDSSWLSKYC